MNLLGARTATLLMISALWALGGCGGGTTSGSGGNGGGGGLSNASTSTVLTASPSPAIVGGVVTLVATVTASAGTPIGSVAFLDGSTTLGTASLSNGAAALSVSTLAQGTHSLTASYVGGTGFNGSTSSAVSLAVNASVGVATTTVLSTSPNPSASGAAVAMTATVTVAGNVSVATGVVTFYDGATVVGTGTLAGGVATLSTSSLAAGTSHTLTAVYAGVANAFQASTSGAVVQVVNAVAAPTSITAHGTLNFTTANQTIAGFGGAEAFYLSYLDSHPYEFEINTALFDPQQGLGLTFLRVQNLYYQYTGSNATTFDVDTPKIVSAANAAHGTPLTLLMSSWSPPAAIKSNLNVNNGGTLSTVNGGYNYAGFAQFWYDSLNAYAALGVTPSYVSIQNEPDYTATYASCRFSATEGTYAGYGLAFDAVYKKLATMATPPMMVGPEAFSVANAVSFAAQIPSTETAALAHHLYNVNSNGAVNTPDAGLMAEQAFAAAYPTQLKFMTEYYQYPGFDNAWEIHNALTVANDNAYIYWGLAWPSTYTAGQAADQEGVIYIDNPFNAQSTWSAPHGWAYNDAYYALKHYSFYVRPGYVRYGASVTDNADERISVYQSTNKKTTVIVVLNTSATVTDGLLLDLSGVAYTGSTVYRSTFSTPINQTGAERWLNLGGYAASGLSLPPQSVATIVLTN